MSGRREGGSEAEGPAPALPRIHLHGETLEALTELNEQCLELLVEEATLPQAARFPLLHSLGELWARLDAPARQRAARCPYLIVDAGFADLRLWEWVGHRGIHDAPAPAAPAFFRGPRASAVLRLVLTYGWHLARSRPSAGRLLLGMPAPCAERIGACTLRQIESVSDRHSEWLQPRWPTRLAAWRELLQTAMEGEGAALDRARMRGLQLLAAEARAMQLR